MRGEGDREVVAYQWLLRAVGAYLDARRARGALIVETEYGFLVRHQVRDSSHLVERYFGYDELLEHRRSLEARRSAEQMRAILDTPAGRYQDFLRALDYELEHLMAYTVLVEEVDRAFVVTYQYLDPRDNYLPRKHLAVLGNQDIERTIEQARARRAPPPVEPNPLKTLVGALPLAGRLIS